ncbi:TolB family protein [Gemmatimonas sp.]|uniref:TolB family protein n=1 Tax=Gemmatimonas sp. TaxID=1962908 RepID=UPI0039831187
MSYIKRASRVLYLSLTLGATLAACTAAPEQTVSPWAAPALSTAATWSAWSSAVPLSELNTPGATEGCPNVVRSGQVLYFASNRPGGYGALDLYVSYWESSAKQWGPALNLGPEINTAWNEQCPLVLQSGRRLVFVSNRPGGVGGLDLWITRQPNLRDAVSWETPSNLTAANSSLNDFGPGSYEENGRTVLYFNSNRLGGAGQQDIYVSTEQRDDSWSTAVPAMGLNTALQEEFPALTGNGLEIFFASNRPGTFGGLDLWHATRASTAAAWTTPVNLGPLVNGPLAEGRSSVSWNGTTLIFHSNRAGSVDLFETTRSRSGPH